VHLFTCIETCELNNEYNSLHGRITNPDSQQESAPPNHYAAATKGLEDAPKTEPIGYLAHTASHYVYGTPLPTDTCVPVMIRAATHEL
jgi:hypothetical protein